MLSAGWFIAAVVVAVLLTAWITFTVTRLDRLHARVDAAQAALDAQLVRRAAAVLRVVDAGDVQLIPDARRRYELVTRQALDATGDVRQAAENEVGRVVMELMTNGPELGELAAAELHEAAERVLIARRFYNDAVRDTRSLRGRRMPRLLHLSGRREMPQFFDIDDTVPSLG
jgi:hypothetical protein